MKAMVVGLLTAACLCAEAPVVEYRLWTSRTPIATYFRMPEMPRLDGVWVVISTRDPEVVSYRVTVEYITETGRREWVRRYVDRWPLHLDPTNELVYTPGPVKVVSVVTDALRVGGSTKVKGEGE